MNLDEIRARWEPRVLHGEFRLRDGTRTDTYTERPLITTSPQLWRGHRCISRDQAHADVAWLLARLDAVLGLHAPDERKLGFVDRFMEAAPKGGCLECTLPWPCPTVRAATGDSGREDTDG